MWAKHSGQGEHEARSPMLAGHRIAADFLDSDILVEWQTLVFEEPIISFL